MSIESTWRRSRSVSESVVVTEWITTREAAQRLGVKRTTLYTYVSRGLLTRRRSGGESLFDRAEIDALAGTRHHPGSPLGVLPMRSVRSSVSEVREGELFLRGVPLADLADEPLAEVVDLVLGLAPEVVVSAPAHLTALPLHRRLPALAQWAGSECEWVDPAAAAGVAKGLLGAAPVALGSPVSDRSVPEGIFVAVAGRPGSPQEVATLNTALVALIDHGLAASVVAARVAASARASAYDCLVAGYAALSGRLHGGIGPSALAVLRNGPAGSPGGPVPGFGHWRHPEGDPRADAILARLALVDGSAPVLARLSEITSLAGRRPNIDGALAALIVVCELPGDAAEVFFQVGRTVGLAAHIVEEAGEDPLRWRATDPTA
jgi:citrate synthase